MIIIQCISYIPSIIFLCKPISTVKSKYYYCYRLSYKKKEWSTGRNMVSFNCSRGSIKKQNTTNTTTRIMMMIIVIMKDRAGFVEPSFSLLFSRTSPHRKNKDKDTVSISHKKTAWVVLLVLLLCCHNLQQLQHPRSTIIASLLPLALAKIYKEKKHYYTASAAPCCFCCSTHQHTILIHQEKGEERECVREENKTMPRMMMIKRNKRHYRHHHSLLYISFFTYI